MENWLKKRVQLSADKQALIFENRVWSFSELYQEVLERCNYLISKKIYQKKRVAIIGENSPELYFYILGLQQLNIETVFINFRLAKSEIEYQLQNSKAELLLKSSEISLDFSTIVEELIFNDSKVSKIIEDIDDYIIDEFNPDVVTSIMYTSGTTGKPKGVLQTFGNHWSSAIGAQLNMPTKQSDTWICAVPIFHISGLSIMMRSLIYGMSVQLFTKFSVEKIDKSLKEGIGNIISVVPYMLKKLIEDKTINDYDNSFSYMLLGGGSIDTATLKKCEMLKIPVIQSYGMTETASQIVALNNSDMIKKVGSAGKPMFTVGLKIAKKDKTDDVGEILIKTPSLTKGYLNNSEKFAEKITTDGWFKTGDVGYLDQDGYLYIKSRLSELIISGGENIYPSEIEHVLLEYPGIKECAVIGKKDNIWGAIPIGFLVTNHNIDQRKLNEYLVGKIAKYKIPKEFRIIDKLPKTASGKIKKGSLYEKL